MKNETAQDVISIEEVVDLLKKHILPEEAVKTEKKIRTKDEYFELVEQMKAAGFSKFEKMLGDLCYRNPNRKMKYKGYCSVCKKEVDLEVDYMFAELIEGEKTREPIWRERLVCEKCHLNNRMRFLVAKIIDEYKPGMKIYINENITNAYKVLKSFIPDLVGSEYLDGDLVSGQVVDGILHEDAMNLSFSNETFDMVISQDVFEHVADYEKGFQEMFRVLKRGGRAIFTVPFDTLESVINQRACMVDGKIEHLEEPMYHGNPLSEEGSLVFQIFSWDLFDQLKKSGFSDAYAYTYYSVEKGNLGLLPFYIVAEK